MMPMNEGKNPDKARMEPKIQASAVPHKGTMANGGSKGNKGAMTGAGGDCCRAVGTVGKYLKTSSG